MEEVEKAARGWVAFGCLAAVGLCLVNAIAPIHETVLWDDAYIFFRYVDNLLAGHGLTWNPGGEIVEGYSSFLYVVVLLIPRLFGAPLPATTVVLNIGLYVATVLLSVLLARHALKAWRPAVFLAPLLVATHSSLSVLSRSGMESMLFAALIVAALLLQARLKGDSSARQQLFSGVVFGLVGLTRPEGSALFIVCFGVTLLSNWRSAGRFLQANAWAQVLGFGLVMGGHLAFRLGYYGEFLPNSVYAKTGLSLEQMAIGWSVMANFLLSFRGALIALSFIGWALTPRCRVGNLVVACLALWMIYLPSIGLNDWSIWYVVPVDLLSCLGAGLALAKGVHKIDLARFAWPAKAVASVCFVGLLLGTTAPARYSAPENPRPNAIEGFIKIGYALRSLAKPGDSVAVGACGAIPYFSRLIVYDTLGLNDKHIAHLEAPPGGWFAHRKGDGRYILDKQPTFMVPYPGLTAEPHDGDGRFEKSFIELFKLPEFQRDYEFKAMLVADGLYFNYYQRK